MATPESRDAKGLLADAIKKRDDLNTFIRMMQELIGTATSETEASSPAMPGAAAIGTDTDPLAGVFAGQFFGKSQPQAARAFLETTKPRPMPTKVIVQALEKGGAPVGGKNKATNLWGVLNRNQKDFILVPKAGWGLVEWYDPAVINRMRANGAARDEEPDGGDAGGV